MTFFAAIEDLIKSFYEFVASAIGTVYSLIHGVLLAIFNFFSGLISLVTDVFSGAVDVVGGVGKFVTGNIVIIAILAAGGFAYVRYQQQQGKQVGVAKKTN